MSPPKIKPLGYGVAGCFWLAAVLHRAAMVHHRHQDRATDPKMEGSMSFGECSSCYWQAASRWAGPCVVISALVAGQDCPSFRGRKLTRAEKKKGGRKG
jgi:hypothetical protein